MPSKVYFVQMCFFPVLLHPEGVPGYNDFFTELSGNACSTDGIVVWVYWLGYCVLYKLYPMQGVSNKVEKIIVDIELYCV